MVVGSPLGRRVQLRAEAFAALEIETGFQRSEIGFNGSEIAFEESEAGLEESEIGSPESEIGLCDCPHLWTGEDDAEDSDAELLAPRCRTLDLSLVVWVEGCEMVSSLTGKGKK